MFWKREKLTGYKAQKALADIWESNCEKYGEINELNWLNKFLGDVGSNLKFIGRDIVVTFFACPSFRCGHEYLNLLYNIKSKYRISAKEINAFFTELNNQNKDKLEFRYVANAFNDMNEMVQKLEVNEFNKINTSAAIVPAKVSFIKSIMMLPNIKVQFAEIDCNNPYYLEKGTFNVVDDIIKHKHRCDKSSNNIAYGIICNIDGNRAFIYPESGIEYQKYLIWLSEYYQMNKCKKISKKNAENFIKTKSFIDGISLAVEEYKKETENELTKAKEDTAKTIQDVSSRLKNEETQHTNNLMAQDLNSLKGENETLVISI